MDDLRGSTAIVTGASRGIGVHLARALAAEGVHLALAARSASELEEVRAEIAATGVRAIAVRCDVTDAHDRAELLERTEAELGPVDILVNNAGIERVSRYHEAPEADTTETLAINLAAPMQLTRAVLPGMLQRGRGHVVNIASGAGKAGVPYGASYCASKHGLVGFTHALNAEYSDAPVNFSVVCPGFVTDVGMYARWEEQGVRAPKLAGSSTPEKVAAVTLRCIKRNKLEATVNTPPVRPLIIVNAIAPSVVPTLLRWFGFAGTFQRVVEAQSARSEP